MTRMNMLLRFLGKERPLAARVKSKDKRSEDLGIWEGLNQSEKQREVQFSA